jgi:hypothetical protein
MILYWAWPTNLRRQFGTFHHSGHSHRARGSVFAYIDCLSVVRVKTCRRMNWIFVPCSREGDSMPEFADNTKYVDTKYVVYDDQPSCRTITRIITGVTHGVRIKDGSMRIL